MNYLFPMINILTASISIGFLPFIAAAASPQLQMANLSSSVLLAQNNPQEFQPRNFEYWANQCLLLNEQRKNTEALVACERAISLQPKKDNLDIWTTRGNVLFYLGKYAESLASYNRVVEASPRNSLAIAGQCANLLQLDRYDDAIDTCEQALRVDGSWGNISPAFAWYYRGLSLQQLGRLETALASFERAIATDPANLQSLAEQCKTLGELGHFTELASTCLPQIAVPMPSEAPSVETAPLSSKAPSVITERCGVVSEIDRPKQFLVNSGLQATVTCYERALTTDPQNPILLTQQGLALEQLGLYERASTAYSRVIELNPTHTIALVHNCGTLNQLKSYEAALASCDRAFQVEGGLGPWQTAYGWNQRSVALLGSGKYEEALAAANKAIEIEQSYAPAWNSRALSMWWLQQGDAVAAIDQAISWYEKAEIGLQDTFERTYPNSPLVIYRGYILALFNKGRILTSRGKYEDAIQAYLRALELYSKAVDIDKMNPLNNAILADIRVNQAAAYLHLSNAEQALASSQQALILDSHSVAGWYNRGLAYKKLGDDACAFDAYTQANQLKPVDANILIEQGISLEGMNLDQDAIVLFERVLSIDPNNILAQQHREAAINRLWAAPAAARLQTSQPSSAPAVPIARCRSELEGQ